MSGFKCPYCDFDPGEHAWSHIVLTKHRWDVHKTPGASGFNFKRVYYPDKETWENRGSMLYPMFKLHKDWTKRVRKNLGLSKYQFLWLTFAKGLVIGYLLAVLFHR